MQKTEEEKQMKINSDINFLGGLPDWSLIGTFIKENMHSTQLSEEMQSTIKTDKSVKRFLRAMLGSLLKFQNPEIKSLVSCIVNGENISHDSLIMLFWNASFNNELLAYLNNQTYFTSFYSGRISIKSDEIFACLKDLKEREIELKKWTDSTAKTLASKYLTMLKKFNLMAGSRTKTILHPYLSDKMFILYVYWLKAIETNPNILESNWLKYSFCEKPIFIERILQMKFSRFFELNYTGDKLKIETSIPYENIYDAVK